MLVSPDDILLSSASIAENQASGSVVGTFTSADADPGETFTYALVPGDGDNNNGSFTIQGSELRTATSFDYEATRALSIRARATDHAGQTVERVFTVSITDVNEAPTLVTLSKASIVEGNTIGAVVGTLSTTDPDAGDTFTYALVAGDGDVDNASFTIVGNALRAAVTFDHATKSGYSIRVRSTDQHGLATEKVVSIRIGQDFLGQDLTAAYLAGRDLVGASFAGAKLRWANLYGACLREADLTNADLTGADLTCANLTDAILDGVTFEGATYSNTTWPAGFDPTNKGMWGPGSLHSGVDLPGGIFASRDFSGSKLDHANLIGANFYGTNLRDVDFTDTNLTSSRFDYANLAGAVLTGAILTGSSYSSGTTWPAGFDPTTKGMWGPGGIYSGMDLRNASLIWRDLIGARFERADLRWANFWGTDLRNVDFTDADLSGAQLEFANLTDSVLKGATLAGATYSPSTRWPAGFDPTAHGMWGPGGDYTGVNAAGANFAWRYLNGAKFIGANLTGVNFQGTTLVDVDFTDANLTGANLDTSFPGVTYSKNTIWPAGFDPVAAGAILVVAPTDIVLSRSSIAENNDVGAVVGTLSTIAPDAGDTFTYALVAGDGNADNVSFTIAGNELRAAVTFDHATKASYTIRVRSTDQHGLATEKTSFIRIGQDFSGQDLTGRWFGSTDLRGASFVGATVRTVDFRSADLRDVDFTGADLTSSLFWNANLTGATLAGATLVDVIYDSGTIWPTGFDPSAYDMWGPGCVYSGRVRRDWFEGFHLAGATFAGANLLGATFRNADLRNADFSGASLWGARLEGADLSGATFTGADLSAAYYSASTIWPVGFDYTTKGMQGPGADFSGLNLIYSYFAWLDLSGAKFVGANASGVSFRGADVRRADFTNANLTAAQFEFANLTDADLTGATLTGAFYAGTTWPAGFDPTAHGMWGPGGDYTGVNAAGVNFAWHYLNGAKFIGANLTGANFQGTTLVDVDFTDANLTGANLDTSFPGVTYSKNTIWPAGFDPVAAGAILVVAPTDIAVSKASIAENNDVGAVVGTLSTIDPDAGDTFTYALVAGDGDADNASFTIGGGELLAAASFDYETRSSYSIRVRSTDQHGLATEKALTISIKDVIDTPTMRRSGGALVALASTYGSASAAAETAVEGMLLTGNITATAPAGFQVSSDGLSWGTTAVFTVTAGAFSGTLGIRLAGTAKAGSYTGGVTLAGGGAPDLVLDMPSSVISKRSLSISGLSARDKTYDGTTTATVLGAPTLEGVVGSDAVQLSGTVAWTFPTTDAGSATLQRGGTYTLLNDPNGNYTLVQPSLAASIRRRPVAVTGVTASDRVYDGSATVAVAGGIIGPVKDVPSSGILAADSGSVRLLTVHAMGTMADKTVGTRKHVTVSGLALDGSKNDNYEITTVNVPLVTITKATLSVDRLGIDAKTYDGTVTAAANLFHPDSASLVGVCGTDDVGLQSIAGTFARATCGTDIPLTVRFTPFGADAGNYNVARVDAIGTILPRPLTIGGLATANRVYDGTVNAVLMGKPRYVGLAPIDAVRLAVPVLTGVPTASFIDRNVGNAKTVVVTGYAAPSGNYVLAPVTLSATITPRPLTVVGAKTTARPYDGTARIVVSAGSLVIGGVLGADSVVLDSQSATGTTTDKNVGANKAVTVAGYAITGADAPNYALRQPNGLRVTISAKPVQVVGLTALGKEYDATTVAGVTGTATLDPTAIVAGDSLEILGSGTYRFASAGVGTDKPIMASGFALGGLDASNYTIRQPGGLAATITRATLTVTGPDLVLVRDAQGAVAVPVLTATISGLKGPDTAAVVWTGRAALSTTATAKSPDGTYVITVRQGTLSLKSGNYVWRFVDGAITIR